MSPGARIRMLRIILGISREDFCEKHNINFNTLTSIELDRLKISQKQLQKMVEAFAKEELHVTGLWIMQAKGIGPTRFFPQEIESSIDFLEKWAHSFCSHNDAVMAQVTSDAMEPYYSEGDLVGGIWHNAPHLLLGKRCIIHSDKQCYIGTLFYDKGMFSSVPSNNGRYHSHALLHQTYVQIAEIAWHIRKHSEQIAQFLKGS